MDFIRGQGTSNPSRCPGPWKKPRAHSASAGVAPNQYTPCCIRTVKSDTSLHQMQGAQEVRADRAPEKKEGSRHRCRLPVGPEGEGGDP